ncbi:pilus assembly protein [Aeromonas cavernicola]|uniref:PilY1 beta-propeller domain-containing protein n=1 Tax=Aeromonas cavernicola TaxID=1006623 RepID=A0A2H9U5Y6_9GAMM|nr:PilC/PilY family type IV pilus protein [Aeromonas cavernicola]PJG59409.1 hypothetical protein CUC53_07450 [Aeromonas cavernicola]
MIFRHYLLVSLLFSLNMSSGPTIAAGTSYSDDTELFVYDFAKAGDFRPKVLFIFDNSGSMGETTLLAKEAYDPTFPYPKLTSDDGRNDYIYYAINGTPPSTLNADNPNRLSANKNACATAINSLATNGLLTSIYWNYDVTGNKNKQKGEWKPLKNFTNNNINIIDCQQDILSLNNDNSGFTGSYQSVSGTTKGYPVNTNSTNLNKPWLDTSNPTSPVTGGTDNLTLYSANYLRWYHAPAQFSASRLTVAKQALQELVRTTPAVDFGLAVFNHNDGDATNNKNGGRVIRQIIGGDTILSSGKTASQDIIDQANSLSAETWTPLCETMYEAYRYFGGLDVYFGDDDPARTPLRDSAAESPLGKYKSPYDKCSNNGYIIYMTDGAPTNDKAADSMITALINTLSAADKITYGTTVGYGSSGAKSYLAALAGYMKNNDINTSAAGKQTVTTFTVGFGDDAIKGAGDLLAETARRGGGKYYPASNATQLNEALKSSLLAILKMNTSLVSPAIATNNFDRTRSLNNIYYAMFEPSAGPRWKGNLKKLVLSPEKGYIVDQSGLPAIASDGTILDLARTYWSTSNDGNRVADGGVQEMLAINSNRNIYVIPPSGNNLLPFTKDKLEIIAGSAANLRTHMTLDDGDSAEKIIDWAKGVDAFDEDNDPTTTIRDNILGDPLHSRPLVINYGCTITTGQTSCTPDLRIVMGTNAGFLHMFQDNGNTVDESWAIIPYPFIAHQKALRENLESSSHIYGMDSSPIVLVNEAIRDGDIKSSQGDKVWLFSGLRGGGRSYYALNISEPSQPSLMWRLDNSSPGFGRLGETWSIPEVAFIPGYSNLINGKQIYKPVLIFSGGYDQAKSALGQGTDDSTGLGIYIVDAETGSLVFSFTPDDDSSTNKKVSTMTFSMPGSVSVLDGDGDGITDRIYAGDTGGNIWRVDMKGSDKSKWSVFKFASLGNSHLTGIAKKIEDDRRFFTQPVLVRTINKGWQYKDTQYIYSERPFDAVLIGSGDRNRPSSEITTKNAYVMLRDYNIKPTLFGVEPNTSIPAAITIDDLYDVTIDPFIGKNDDQIVSTTKLLTSQQGWKFWLNETGEKSMGSGLVLQGKLYFTSFLPQVQDFQQCTIQSIGAMRQYMIDMHYGTSFKYELDSSGQQVPQRYVEVNNKVADDLVIHGGDDSGIRIIGGAPGSTVILKGDTSTQRCTEEDECSQGTEETNMDMSPKKIYLYEGEQK